MTPTLFQTPQYQSIMKKHIQEVIRYLFDQNQEFAVACKVKQLTFTPELPAEIKESFNETVLFILSGYTYESSKLEGETFVFEAGFGNDNFGSLVTVPLLAIKQLFVNDNALLINIAEPAEKTSSNENRSMEALLSNPKNKGLLKKNK